MGNDPCGKGKEKWEIKVISIYKEIKIKGIQIW